jgi:hypothetical protein
MARPEILTDIINSIAVAITQTMRPAAFIITAIGYAVILGFHRTGSIRPAAGAQLLFAGIVSSIQVTIAETDIGPGRNKTAQIVTAKRININA